MLMVMLIVMHDGDDEAALVIIMVMTARDADDEATDGDIDDIRDL